LTQQIKFLLEDLAILACIWLLNHCSGTFQLQTVLEHQGK